ncbi:nuclear transport factor 2 family protein [Nesterenkonia sp. PF2B19]|uniref:nuclear transport factor 2 family protein n=1 Tax=Nesterenkonia sp. PF2B19 TaxID=1881858 RepID=UPI000A19F4BA|nr:nuclear transport factor 2 family protein [Nesterenkonia sp. PF2B19]OSM42301.1 ketosteroid isomerase [Nesterenkonia sp. PF2B19]
MSESTPAAVAATYFEALGRGDMPTAMAQFSAQVVWHQPGAHRFSGQHIGVEAVGAHLGRMMEASEGTFQVAPTGSAMVNGGFIAVPVRFSATRPGTAMDMAGVDLLTIQNAEIVAVHLFSEDGAAEDAFWGAA